MNGSPQLLVYFLPNGKEDKIAIVFTQNISELNAFETQQLAFLATSITF